VLIEKEVLLKLDHPGVVKYYYSFQDEKNLYFCLEYMEGGDFSELLEGTSP